MNDTWDLWREILPGLSMLYTTGPQKQTSTEGLALRKDLIPGKLDQVNG